MPSPLGLGVDGGGSKTALVLTDATGRILARHQAPGCNPNVAGRDAASATLREAMAALRAQGPADAPITHTLLSMAGNREHWRTFGAELPAAEFGRVWVTDDSRPVLELATSGRPGLVLHGGTGSFVAALTAPGSPIRPGPGSLTQADPFLPGWLTHYAGGLGWRLGDAGSGHDLGRRALTRALLEAQGWAPASGLGPALAAAAGTRGAEALTRFLYEHSEPNAWLASLAPTVLDLAAANDEAARAVVLASAQDLGALAHAVCSRLWSAEQANAFAIGLSGPILHHPAMHAALLPHCPGEAKLLNQPPIAGVEQLLARLLLPAA
jgi:N-acetylglucosamine kinase-like BadF-type ATPase